MKMRKYAQDVAHLQRYLGSLAQHRRLSAGFGRPIRQRRQVGGVAQPGTGRMRICCPWGVLGPAAGWGQRAAHTRLTHDEQRTLMTLWSIFPSPLMVGGETAIGRRLDSLTADQPRSDRVGPALNRESAPSYDRQDGRVGGAVDLDEHPLLGPFQFSESSQALQLCLEGSRLPGSKYKLRDLCSAEMWARRPRWK